MRSKIMTTGHLRSAVSSICIGLAWAVSTAAHAELTTSFDGDSLDSNLHLDIPNSTVGTISLDTVNHSLLFKGTGADLWYDRNGLPYAWTAIPQVGVGGVWRAETEVKYNVADHMYGRIAGLTIYSGPDGTGGSSAGQEFTFGLDQWDGPNGVWVQGLGDNQPGNSSNLAAELSTDMVDLRMDVTVGESHDNTYDFSYKLPGNSTWISLGSIQNVNDDGRIALFFKGDAMDVSFNYFNVIVVPEPSSTALAGIGAIGLLLARFRKQR